MTPKEYVELIFDEYEELWRNIKSQDPLNFVASKSYKDQLKKYNEQPDASDSIRIFSGKIDTTAVTLCVMDFSFIGGSMGSVVGEKISRAITLSQRKNTTCYYLPSGGARMQEGAISLMQLAKICSKLSEFSSKTNLLITVLTNPTMGGTTASYAMLGDVILAEPNALIGFAGQRVIKQTIGEDLPEGFQRAEFLKEHGFIDDILARDKNERNIIQFNKFFSSKEDIKFNEA